LQRTDLALERADATAQRRYVRGEHSSAALDVREISARGLEPLLDGRSGLSLRGGGHERADRDEHGSEERCGHNASRATGGWRGHLLFPALTGLAVGLALKEMRYAW
jgi:hypothetical protein